MTDTIRWGILGTGTVARAFAQDLRFAKGAELAAVGSRRRETADRFGDSFGIPFRHASYEALANDPSVDVVYIATPNSLHKEHTLLCLDAGKAVLCEKPFALNAAEARAMVTAARERGLFLMEAMWTRFIPLTVHLRELLAENALGEIRMLTADFGFRGDFEPEGILWNRAYGGGSLLDVGVYPVSFASMLFGKPSRIATMAHLGKSGVDELAGIVFGYEGGRMAVLHSAIAVETPQEATVMGDTAYARIGRPFWSPLKMTLVYPDERKRMVERPYLGSGYQFEAEEVMACLRAGKTESAGMPLDETVAIMETMDAIRAEWGLTYPGDPV